MGGRYCAINSPLGSRWGQKSLDLRSRDFCPHLEPRGELIAQYRPPMSFRYNIIYHITSRWVLAMPNNNVIRHWYSSNVNISKLRWMPDRYCLRRVPQKLLVICGSINEYWQSIPISSEVQHPDLNHYKEFFMGVQPTKLGIIPHPTSKMIT